jgi:hypothetical protein
MVLLELLIFFYFNISWLIEMVDTYEHFVAFGTDLGMYLSLTVSVVHTAAINSFFSRY